MQIVFARWKGPKTCFLCQEPINKKAKKGEVQQEEREENGVCKECEGSKPASEHSGDVWYQHRKTDASYVIPHISSYITAIARVTLWNCMKMVIERGGNLYYLDTDSCVTDVELPTSTVLGALKDEYGDCGCPTCVKLMKEKEKPIHRSKDPGFVTKDLEGTFVQPKCYMLESPSFEEPKVTLKGFPYRRTDSGHERCVCDACKVAPGVTLLRGHKKGDKGFKACSCSECIIRCKENLLKLQAGETLAWRQLEKVRTLAALGFSRGPIMKGIAKSFKGSYDKRVILADGLTTRAVVLDETVLPSSDFHADDAAAE